MFDQTIGELVGLTNAEVGKCTREREPRFKNPMSIIKNLLTLKAVKSQ